MKRTITVGALFTAAALALVASPAGAAPATTVADWQMNEAPGSTVLVDSGPNGVNGTIGTSITLDGSVHTYPTILRGNGGAVDPQHLDIINSPSLNPGTADFSVTVRFKIANIWQSTGNIMQKGQTGTKGGFWKIQLDDKKGHVACDFIGADGKAGAVQSKQLIDDNAWHVLTCRRSATNVTTTVDGITTRIGHVVGNIANTIPLSIGGKSLCSATPGHDCDYFVGQIDYVTITTG